MAGFRLDLTVLTTLEILKLECEEENEQNVNLTMPDNILMDYFL